MATFTVSLGAIVPISATVQIVSDNAADAQAKALAMQAQGVLTWTYKYVPIGTYSGPVTGCWALGSSPFNVSLVATIPISATVTVQAPDSDSAIAQAKVFQSQAQLSWTFQGHSVGAYVGPVSEAWTTLVVTPPPLVIPVFTTTVLTVSSPTTGIEVPVSLVATVSAKVTGPVRFMAGLTLLGVVTPNSFGVATLAAVSLPAGRSVITAYFTGDATYAPSTSNTVTVTVSPATTTTALAITPNPAQYGQPAVMTATVTASIGIAVGSVVYYDGTTLIGVATLVDGVATLSISTLAGGAHQITAMYAGISGFLASTSSAVGFTVTQVVTTTTVFTVDPTVVYGTTIPFQFTVSSGFGIPTGSVTVQANQLEGELVIPFGTFELDDTGNAYYSISTLPADGWLIVATYASNAQFAGSVSDPFSEDVLQSGGTLTYFVNPASSGPGDFPLVTIYATLIPEVPGTLGTGNFLIGAQNTNTLACYEAAVPAVNNQAIFQFTPAGSGDSYMGVVDYEDDPNFAVALVTFNFGPYG